MTGMAISLERLAEQDDRTHFDVFLDVFTQSLNIVEPDSDGLLDYYISTIKVIEMYEENCPQSGLIMPLLMTTLDIAAEYGMKVHFPGATVALYEYQRDKFIGYSEYFSPVSFNSRLASIDGKMILPYILNGQREEARSVGEEAYNLLKELLPQNPRKYLADFLSVCANLGGIYMDANELDAADRVFRQGSTA